MSFMYNPFPYDDPNAINRIAVAPSDRAAIVKGLSASASALAKAAMAVLKEKGTCVLALDGYISAPFEVLARQVARSLAQQGAEVRIMDAAVLYKEESVLKDELLRYLPEDRAEDPPLLYGRLYGEGYEGLMDESRIKAFGNEIGKVRSKGAGAAALHSTAIGKKAGSPRAMLNRFTLQPTPYAVSWAVIG